MGFDPCRARVRFARCRSGAVALTTAGQSPCSASVPDPLTGDKLKLHHCRNAFELLLSTLHRKKNVSNIPDHSRDVTYQTLPLGGREKFNCYGR